MEAISDTRLTHVQRGLKLEYLTIGYNLLEAAGAVISGLLAGSVALVGFGLDSLIEVTSGATLIWRLRGDHGPEREKKEQTALRIVGGCFLALAVYIAIDSVKSLLLREAPQESIWGIALAVASIIVMPLLARAKRRVAASIGSASMKADARQTELCTYLSLILLAGLALNAAFGWWWADPLAGLLMVPVIAKEGIDALNGKECGCSGHCQTSTQT